MRIGIDMGCWPNRRGYGRYTRQLLPALFRAAPDDRFLLFADAGDVERAASAAPNVSIVRVRVGRPASLAAAAGSRRSLRDMGRLTRAVRRARPDVFFVPSVYSYFPLPPGLPLVVGIHDAIADRFPSLTLPSWKDRLFWRAKVSVAIRQAHLVLTVSEYAARQIRETLGVPQDKIRIAVEAPAPAYRPGSTREEIRRVAEEVGIPRGASWFTYVGGFSPHKNVEVLVRAHADVVARATPPSPHLLLVGSTEGDPFLSSLRQIRSAIESVGTGNLVHWTGFLPDEQLRHLHAGARALVLPSAAEGFGLPAVEAAACGAPVVATTESPLPQILRGGGLFVPPGDPSSLAAALLRLLEEPGLRESLGSEALRRATRLSWSRTAQTVLGVLREAAACRSGCPV